MTKDEAEAIHALARQLLEEDVSVERRCRLARKIIEHARAIKASCMVEPQIKIITGPLKSVTKREVLESGVVFKPVHIKARIDFDSGCITVLERNGVPTMTSEEDARKLAQSLLYGQPPYHPET